MLKRITLEHRNTFQRGRAFDQGKARMIDSNRGECRFLLNRRPLQKVGLLLERSSLKESRHFLGRDRVVHRVFRLVIPLEVQYNVLVAYLLVTILVHRSNRSLSAVTACGRMEEGEVGNHYDCDQDNHQQNLVLPHLMTSFLGMGFYRSLIYCSP